MSIVSKRLVSIAASTLVLSLVSADANAQIDVLTGGNNEFFGPYYQTVISTYTFNRSMILNSVGFVEGFSSNVSNQFFINGVEQSDSGTYMLEDGVRWLTLSSPITVQENAVLTVSTLGYKTEVDNETLLKDYSTSNSSAYVTFVGTNIAPDLRGAFYSNSNLSVSPSNPGSNVAPEPGSFALALTGGAALIGICVRRRRNAG